MAWIVCDLDDTLVMKQQMELDDPSMPVEPQDTPIPGAVEAMTELAQQGHRLTVFTARFAPMPDEVRQRLKEEIEASLQALGFPEMEVWTGTTKPDADIFIDNKAVTFDQDWPLALAQTQAMLEDRGLAQQAPAFDQVGLQQDEEQPEAQPQPEPEEA